MKTGELVGLLQRIEELERKVRQLEECLSLECLSLIGQSNALKRRMRELEFRLIKGE